MTKFTDSSVAQICQQMSHTYSSTSGKIPICCKVHWQGSFYALLEFVPNLDESLYVIYADKILAGEISGYVVMGPYYYNHFLLGLFNIFYESIQKPISSKYSLPRISGHFLKVICNNFIKTLPNVYFVLQGNENCITKEYNIKNIFRQVHVRKPKVKIKVSS